jgi:hypothetical protein
VFVPREAPVLLEYLSRFWRKLIVGGNIEKRHGISFSDLTVISSPWPSPDTEERPESGKAVRL